MSERRVERHKMYAHVYFDLAPSGKLGIAVYSVARIPGFAGKPSEIVQQHLPDINNAHSIFLKTLKKEPNSIDMAPQDIQLGRVFTYDQLGEKISEIDTWGKAQAMNPNASVVVDLDDPKLWIPADSNYLPEAQRQELGEAFKDKYLDFIQQPATNYIQALSSGNPDIIQSATQKLEHALQKMYVIVARKLNSKDGGKHYPARQSPPTMIVSKELNIAYYPGFRGSPYMAEVPRSSKTTYNHMSEPDQNWHSIIIPSVNSVIAPYSIDEVQIEVLDQITEVLARLFFKALSRSGMDLKIADFNQALIPVTDKAMQLLKRIGDDEIQEQYKKASQYIGVFIDLGSGQVFDNLPSLLAAKQRHVEEQEMAKAAGVKYE